MLAEETRDIFQRLAENYRKSDQNKAETVGFQTMQRKIPNYGYRSKATWKIEGPADAARWRKSSMGVFSPI